MSEQLKIIPYTTLQERADRRLEFLVAANTEPGSNSSSTDQRKSSLELAQKRYFQTDKLFEIANQILTNDRTKETYRRQQTELNAFLKETSRPDWYYANRNFPLVGLNMQQALAGVTDLIREEQAKSIFEVLKGATIPGYENDIYIEPATLELLDPEKAECIWNGFRARKKFLDIAVSDGEHAGNNLALRLLQQFRFSGNTVSILSPVLDVPTREVAKQSLRGKTRCGVLQAEIPTVLRGINLQFQYSTPDQDALPDRIFLKVTPQDKLH